MSHRSIALASCLVLAACGGAPPPPAEGAPPAAGAAAASGNPDATAEEKPVMQGTKPGASESPPARSGSPADAHASDKDKGAPGQAVVESSEPISGKLTQADIARILEKNGDVFGDCYTLGAGGKTKDFKGVVTVKATIGPSGTVNQVDVTKSTANNAKVDACVRDAFKRIKFPKPRDGATSVITFPISFNGVEQIQ